LHSSRRYDFGAVSSTVHANAVDYAENPVSDLVTVRGKELFTGASVGEARALFENRSVQLVPLLDGRTYIGAVTRDGIEGASDGDALADHLDPQVPVTTASTPLAQALRALDPSGGRRLVVVADDRPEYVGLICLHRDRVRLCVDADCRVLGIDT
jgi:CBS domain-containing protein